MAIDVEISAITVQALANIVGQPSDGEDVACSVKQGAVVRVQAVAREDFVVDRVQARVVGLEVVGHVLMITYGVEWELVAGLVAGLRRN